MATLRELYDTDFTRVLNIGKPLQVQLPTGLKEIHARVHLDFEANAKYVSCYLPAEVSTEEVCASVLRQIDDLLAIADGVETQLAFPGEQPVSSTGLRFAGRLFLYHDGVLSDDVMARLGKRRAHTVSRSNSEARVSQRSAQRSRGHWHLSHMIPAIKTGLLDRSRSASRA
jgi:hypothetical protein